MILGITAATQTRDCSIAQVRQAGIHIIHGFFLLSATKQGFLFHVKSISYIQLLFSPFHVPHLPRVRSPCYAAKPSCVERD